MGIMNLSEIMDSSIDILKKYIKTILIYTLLYGIICMFFTIIIAIPTTIISIILYKVTSSAIVLGIFIGIVCILVFAVYMTSKVGIIKISSQDVLKERFYAGKVISTSIHSIPKIFGILLCEILLFIPVGGAFAGLYYAVYIGYWKVESYTSAYLGKPFMYIIAFILLSILLLFAFVAYYTLFIFTFYSAVIENAGVFTSIKRSIKLVKGSYWRIFACVILISITVSIIRLSLDSFLVMIGSVLYIIFKTLNISRDFLTFVTMIVSIFRWPLSILEIAIIAPLNTIMVTYIYFNQRFKKEGLDISLKIKEIEKNNERKQSSEVN